MRTFLSGLDFLAGVKPGFLRFSGGFLLCVRGFLRQPIHRCDAHRVQDTGERGGDVGNERGELRLDLCHNGSELAFDVGKRYVERHLDRTANLLSDRAYGPYGFTERPEVLVCPVSKPGGGEYRGQHPSGDNERGRSSTGYGNRRCQTIERCGHRDDGADDTRDGIQSEHTEEHLRHQFHVFQADVQTADVVDEVRNTCAKFLDALNNFRTGQRVTDVLQRRCDSIEET